jgi:hypothetical protein
MSNQIYKGHLVVVFAIFDKEVKRWVPMIDISWEDAAIPDRYRHKGPSDRFTTQQDAEIFAMEAAKAWVDAHVTRPSQIG